MVDLRWSGASRRGLCLRRQVRSAVYIILTSNYLRVYVVCTTASATDSVAPF